MENRKLNRLSYFGNKLKPFFDFRIENVEDFISLSVGITVFGIIVFRAYFVDITYDEAYTYLNTGRIQDVWKVYLFRIANTHLLNSLLMTVTTLVFPYNDFAIRFPSVFISGFYIVTSISFSKKFNNRLIVLGLLLLFYYVIEYMALARGYGMSATFILAAFFVYKDKERFQDYYLWVTYFFLIAIYASYVALIPYGMFMVYMFIVDFKGRLPVISAKNIRWIIGLTVVAVYGFYSVTKAGKPLPSIDKYTFMEAIPLDVLSRFFNTNNILIPYVVAGVLVLLALVVLIQIIDKGKNVFSAITVLTFSTIIVVAWVGDKQFPSGRVLVPYWPMIALTFVEILEFITNKIRLPKRVVRGFNFIVLGMLIFNFQSQLHFTNYMESKSAQWKTPINIMSNYGTEIFPNDSYYLEKDWRHDIISSKLESVIPDETWSNSAGVFKKYTDLGLITITFLNEPEGVKLYREVLKRGNVTYSDTISLDSEIYNFENNRPMLLPYPKIGGENLRVGNVDGTWEQTFRIPEGMEIFIRTEAPQKF